MDCTTTLYCIYPSYTVNTVNTTIQPPNPQQHHPLNQSNLFVSFPYTIPFTFSSNLSNYFLYLISYLLLYYIINQLSPSILSIQSDFYYYISSLFNLNIIFNIITHHSISFYLIHYTVSILYQYNIYYHII